MRLTELFVPETVVTDLPATDRDATLAAIVADLAGKGLLVDAETALRDVIAREQVMTTGVGHGVAIPHAYTGGVDRLVAGFYRPRPGVDFGATDGQAVDLIFLVLGPRERRREHIRILARISRLLGNADFRDELRKAAGSADVMNVFRRFGDR
jgi:mannitol/fructose-specific phosphotransferase system IIA component (Ntr-type)